MEEKIIDVSEQELPVSATITASVADTNGEPTRRLEIYRIPTPMSCKQREPGQRILKRWVDIEGREPDIFEGVATIFVQMTDPRTGQRSPPMPQEIDFPIPGLILEHARQMWQMCRDQRLKEMADEERKRQMGGILQVPAEALRNLPKGPQAPGRRR